MKTTEEQRHHAYVVVAIVGGSAAVLFVLSRSAGAGPGGSPPTSSARPSTHGRRSAVAPGTTSTIPNPANASLEESMIQAREAALATFDQSSVAERGLGEQYALGLAQTNAAQAIAYNTNATQLKETGMTTSTYQAIADREAQVQAQQIAAQQSVASQYASAQQTQAQGGFWGSILGGLGGLLGLLGFNIPTSGGVGYVNAADYANPFAVQDPFGAIGAPAPPSTYTQGIPWPTTIGG